MGISSGFNISTCISICLFCYHIYTTHGHIGTITYICSIANIFGGILYGVNNVSTNLLEYTFMPWTIIIGSSAYAFSAILYVVVSERDIMKEDKKNHDDFVNMLIEYKKYKETEVVA